MHPPLKQCTKTSQYTYPWLQSLKATELHQIAQATGIKSAGPKPALIQRLDGELQNRLLLGSRDELYGKGGGRGKGKAGAKDISILSIDMGIRNLAFAHLFIPAASSSTSTSTYMSGPISTAKEASPSPSPILTAWRRLSVPDFSPETLLSPTPAPIPKIKPKRRTKSLSPKENQDLNQEEEDPSPPPPPEEKEPEKDPENFTPAYLAPQAYTLLTTLLATYKPTHVLIERQRFRSGGGSAVQEWTLRVGVFEGMLWAVLYALGRGLHSSSSKGVGGPVVVGVEPGRVGGFLSLKGGDGKEGEDESEDVKEKEVKKKGSKEGKKVKIDMVGRWLDSVSLSEDVVGRGDVSRVQVGTDAELHRWINAYLAKWGGGRGKKDDSLPEIGKLDDLADCLVQGVTWLDWQVMRERVAREGAGAVV